MRGLSAFERDRFAVTAQIEHAAEAGGGEALERPALLPPIDEVRSRRRTLVDFVLEIRGPDHDQALRLAERQRGEQHLVDETEQGRVRADAERERQHGDGGEAGVFPQQAQGETKVIHWFVVRGPWSVVSRQLSVVPFQVPLAAFRVCSIHHSSFIIGTMAPPSAGFLTACTYWK